MIARQRSSRQAIAADTGLSSYFQYMHASIVPQHYLAELSTIIISPALFPKNGEREN